MKMIKNVDELKKAENEINQNISRQCEEYNIHMYLFPYVRMSKRDIP